MTTPNPTLLNKLSRSKLMPRWAPASVGVGERRSKHKGSGFEFADHREYQPGDDLRRLDPHLFARFGQNFIREYDVYRQLPITILIDASRSMNYGDPNKFHYATNLASSLAFVGLAGGDQVQVGIGSGDKVIWSSRFHGVSRAQTLFDWIGTHETEGSGSFAAALRVASRHLVNRGLLIVISDWWADDLDAELALLSATGQEVWGLHVLAREEINPEVLGGGEVRLTDVESGYEVEMSLDHGTLDRYRKSFEAWRDKLQGLFNKARGRYLITPTDQSADKLILQDWRKLGIIV
ncbi:MAG: DUF58 domain-containing protein [Bauldia sp.]